ncbi:MAG: cytidylate kinase family protein [Magnetococcales bacterium]|nr:cytidylate kinase family protein [Magnetococcales bacterium]MBF0309608.1 cytidylate kinase family protein [Magnetococcales bacterium]
MQALGAIAHMASIVEADVYSTIHDEEKLPSVPVVTISRTYGTPGMEIGHLLAKYLNVGYYDRELLNVLCRQSHADRHLLEALYEKPIHAWDELLYGLLGKGGNAELLHLLPKIMENIQRTGGVVLGRGAHLLATSRPIFRVALDGSLPVCTKRVMSRMQISEKKARELIQEKNNERNAFVRSIFERHPSMHHFYEMEINTDLFTPDQAVTMILTAMNQKGFMLPKETRDALPKLVSLHPEESGVEEPPAHEVGLPFRTGEVIFRQGETSENLYMVLQGSVELTRESPEGNRRLVAMIEEGDILDDLSLFTHDKVRFCTAVACERTRLLPLTEMEVTNLLSRGPGMALRLLRNAALRLGELHGRLSDSSVPETTPSPFPATEI